MIKKLQFKSWLLMLLMMLGVTNAWAEEVTLKYSGSTTNMTESNNAESLGLSATDWNVTAIKGSGSNLPGLNKDGSIRLYVNGNGFTVTSLNENITIQSIAITFTGANYSNATVLVNGDEVTASDGVYEIGASSFTIKNNQLTGGSQVRISSIVMTYTTGGTPTVATPVFNPEGGIYVEAQSVTISCSTEGAAIQYSTDNGATWTNYMAAISVSETTTIQAKATKTDYNDSQVASATYTIELPSSIADVREQETGDVFTKGIVTSCVGTTGYIQDATAAICVYGASLTVGDEITVSGTLSTYRGLLEITNPTVNVLSSGNSVTSTVMTIAEINADNAPQGKFVKIVDATVTAIESPNTTIEQNGATIVVRGISSDVVYAVGDALTLEGNIGCFDVAQIANPQNVVVQKSEKQEAGLAYETTEYTINLGESFTAPTLTNPNSLAVTYESSNTDLATVDENGSVTLVADATGTTTITASFAGNDTYLPGSASYTLTVVDPNAPGASAENPYTVAQARAAIDANAGVTGVYATGIVSEIVTAYNSKYGNISYNISADGTTTADQLQAYRGKSYNGENFTSADDIQVGDVVVIYGNLKKYNSTYEFDSDNQLVSLNRPVNTDPVINASDVTLAYDATSGAITYSIENPVTGSALEASTDAEWISNIVVDAAAITFTTTANEGTEDRTAIITLTYGDVTKDITVTQGHFVVDYATLPFEYDGNGSGTLPIGLTQGGLGTYGSSPAMKFDGTGDELVLKFNGQPGTLSFDIKGNSFSGGTFKVQTSVDGVTYTDLKTYTELGDIQSEEFDIAADVRYIKWVYTEKSSGNVALGNIVLAKYAAKYAVHIGENITNGTVTADKAEAAEGATVTLTATPAENYVFGAWTVTTESGTSVEVEDNTFVMPAEPVTVSATFTEIVVKAGDYKKVTSSADLTDGEYLIVYEGALVAFNGGLETLDATSNTIGVEINGNVIPSSTEVDAATFTIDVTAGTLKSKSGQYIGVSSNSNGLKQTEDAETYTHTFSIDEEGNAVISAAFEGSTMSLRFNKATDQARFRYYKDAGQEAIQLYKKVASDETLKGDVNRDGKQSIADVTALVNIILGKVTEENNPDDYDFKAADVNNDGSRSIADVTALVNIILGKTE